MNDNHNHSHYEGSSPRTDFETATLKSAAGSALVVTLVALILVRMMTGISGFGAFGVALLAFCLSFGLALRASRGHRS